MPNNDKALNFKPKILKQIRENKLLRFGVILILCLVIYKFYVWIYTETTDNAYIQSDITLVSAEINGKIIEVLTKENIHVNAGDILAKIDDTDYKAALEQAVAKLQAAEYALKMTEQKIAMEQTNLEKAQGNMQTAQVSFEAAERDYTRSSNLTKDNFSSKKNLDNARVAMEQARNNLSQSQLAIKASEENSALLNIQKHANLSDIDAARQAIVIAEKNMKNTIIRAPITGITARNGIRLGNFVVTGMPLVYIVPDLAYIVANFKETQVSRFKDGLKVVFSLDALSGKYEGVIRNISPASGATFSLIPVDNATGNFTKIVQRIPVTIDFDRDQKGLESVGVGMSVSVSVDTR